MLDALTRRVFRNAQDKLIGKVMAEHCDKRIANARKAIDREEKRLRALVRRRIDGGPTVSQIDAAFQRIRAALDLQ